MPWRRRHAFFDKVPPKFAGYDAGRLRRRRRARRAAGRGAPRRLLAKNVVLMPSYVNIGAYVGEGTMVDTWATVGSCAADRHECAPLGRRRYRRRARTAAGHPDHHRGRLLHRRPLRDRRGRHGRADSVMSMGVFIGEHRSTTAPAAQCTARCPPGSVVVPGSLPEDGKLNLYCAVIVKRVDAQTRAKTAINELLRRRLNPGDGTRATGHRAGGATPARRPGWLPAPPDRSAWSGDDRNPAASA